MHETHDIAISQNDYIGLIPAAGYANRISPLPCSKEIYPVGQPDGTRQQPRVISSYLLESMQAADVNCAYMIIRNGKWDIPEYFCRQSYLQVNIAYLVTRPTPGVPYTIDTTYPFVSNSNIAFGFPDIFFKPYDAFEQLIKKQKKTKADVVLGLFNTDDPKKMDMVELRDDEQIQSIIVKPKKTDLKFTWIIAVWSPVFTGFMHSFLTDEPLSTNSELYVGHIIQHAIDSGLKVEFVKFPKGFYLDIGTPADLNKAMEINKDK